MSLSLNSKNVKKSPNGRSITKKTVKKKRRRKRTKKSVVSHFSNETTKKFLHSFSTLKKIQESPPSEKGPNAHRKKKRVYSQNSLNVKKVKNIQESPPSERGPNARRKKRGYSQNSLNVEKVKINSRTKSPNPTKKYRVKLKKAHVKIEEESKESESDESDEDEESSGDEDEEDSDSEYEENSSDDSSEYDDSENDESDEDDSSDESNEASEVVKEEEKVEQKAEDDENLRYGIIKDYNIIKFIGGGMFGSVFQAHEVDTNRTIAVKRIKIKNQVDITKIGKEIQFLTKFKHMHIVSCFGYSRVKIHFEDYIDIFLEFCNRKTIMDYFGDIQLMEKKIYCLQIYLKQLVDGLVYLHANGVVHRDIKPSNLLMTAINDVLIVKLADFGEAKELMSKDSLTLSIAGTPIYCSPQVFNRAYSNIEDMQKNDIWCLGLSIVEIILDRDALFEVLKIDKKIANAQLAVIKHISTLTKLGEIPKKITDENLRDLIGCCLKISAGERISAEKLQDHKFFKTKIFCKNALIAQKGEIRYGSMCSSDFDEDSFLESFSDVSLYQTSNK